MIRSLIVILLAVICGVSAAIGVIRLTPRTEKASVETRSVYVAAAPLRRGSKIDELDIKEVQWPVDLIPQGVITNKDDVIGRSALSSVSTNEPLMGVKISDAKGSGGFASNRIPPGMRACTIQTKGASESVAGLVSPGDKVDVLLNLRGTSRDETGGGSTLTLLQSAEILAIDDVMDIDNTILQKWVQAGFTSVTLLVTPEQAMLVSLGQAAGTMSLALRNGDDAEYITDTRPVTLNQVRNMPAANTLPLQEFLKESLAARDGSKAASDQAVETGSSIAGSGTDEVKESGRSIQAPEKLASVAQERNRQSYIYTLRGNQSGMVRVLELGETKP